MLRQEIDRLWICKPAFSRHRHIKPFSTKTSESPNPNAKIHVLEISCCIIPDLKLLGRFRRIKRNQEVAAVKAKPGVSPGIIESQPKTGQQFIFACLNCFPEPIHLPTFLIAFFFVGKQRRPKTVSRFDCLLESGARILVLRIESGRDRAWEDHTDHNTSEHY